MNQNQQETPAKKWYQGTAAIVILLILFFPVGLYLMWEYSTGWNKWVKIAVTVILAIIVIANLGVDYNLPVCFGIMVCIWLIINELISIIENIGVIGVPMPSFLVKAIKKLKITFV
jgi:phage-related holin